VRKTLLVCRRELSLLFGGPLAWVLCAVFALLANYFFYSDLTFYVVFGGANLSAGLWRYAFLDWRLVAQLVLPLVTMRMFAEERKLGTLELLWTLPVRDHELLAGKYLAGVLVYVVMLATTLVGPLVLHALHDFPLRPLLPGYIGLLLLGSTFVAVGLAASAATENQVVSAMLTYGVLVLLWFVSWNEAALSERVAPVILALSFFDRFYGFAQGVIDLRDVAAFVAFTLLFLFVALRTLGARTWRGIA
jgi:ABC-2 type transport system permease protein